MSKPLYRAVLGEAWSFAVAHKRLWILGFFAGLLGTTAIVEVFLKAWNRVGQDGWDLVNFVQNAYPGAILVSLTESLRTDMLNFSGSAIFTIIILIAAAVFLFWFFSVSEAAAFSAIQSKMAQKKTIPELLRANKKFGWPVFAVHLVSKIILALLLLITSLPLVAMAQYPSSAMAAAAFISFLIFFPLTLIVSFLTLYSALEIVLKKEKIVHAVHNAWNIFRKNWIISIELALILFAVSLLGGLLIAFFGILLVVPVFLLGLAAIVSGFPFLFAAVSAAAALILILAAITLGAFLSLFQLAAWTLLWQKLARGNVLAEVVRFIRSVPNFFAPMLKKTPKL